MKWVLVLLLLSGNLLAAGEVQMVFMNLVKQAKGDKIGTEDVSCLIQAAQRENGVRLNFRLNWGMDWDMDTGTSTRGTEALRRVVTENKELFSTMAFQRLNLFLNPIENK